MKLPIAQFKAASVMPEDQAISWLTSQPEVRRWIAHLVKTTRGDNIGRPRKDDSHLVEAILAAVPNEASARSQGDLMRTIMAIHRSNQSTLRRVIGRMVADGRLLKIRSEPPHPYKIFAKDNSVEF